MAKIDRLRDFSGKRNLRNRTDKAVATVERSRYKPRDFYAKVYNELREIGENLGYCVFNQNLAKANSYTRPKVNFACSNMCPKFKYSILSSVVWILLSEYLKSDSITKAEG